MKPVNQTSMNSINGNCLQACVASILELDLNAVPNFVENSDWTKSFADFLAGFGMVPVFLNRERGDIGGYVAGELGGWWSIVSGKSPRGDFYHAVVAHNGELVHDPYPDGNCELVTILDEIVFVVKDPAVFVSAENA